MNLFTLLAVVVIVTIAYWISFSVFKIKISSKLVQVAVPYSLVSGDDSKTLLVLGDSTAVGVGSTHPTDTVGAQLAQLVSATYVENLAVSGAQVKDLSAQIKKASKDHYDFILLQIGANDILRLHSIEDVVSVLESDLLALTQRGDHIIFITAGNVGAAPILPPPLRLFYTKTNLVYHEKFQALSEKHTIQYVNLYQDPKDDPFVQNPKKYFAGDSFHPSSAGYGLWFEKIKSTIKLP